MALQGTLDTFALPDVLRLLASTKKTGRLRVSGGRGTGSVWVDAGTVVSTEATGTTTAERPVDVIFELLRYRDGSFTFESDKAAPYPDVSSDVEPLLIEAEQLLSEWRSIESVVPSLDHWVSLVAELPRPDVVVDAERWRAIVAVGSGASVRRVGDALGLGEVPVSRQVKDLVELGLVTVGTAPAGQRTPDPFPTSGGESFSSSAQAPAATPAPAPAPAASSRFGSSFDIDGFGTGGGFEVDQPHIAGPEPAPEPARRGFEGFDSFDSYESFEPAPPLAAVEPAPAPAATADDEQAAIAPVSPLVTRRTLGRPIAPPTSADAGDDDASEVARQLASLSPKAARAVAAAARASTDEEREAALAEVSAETEEPINRGLLLKFLSSVRS